MIRIIGKSGKSEIVNAIQKYNGAIIYSYYDALLPFENCYHVNDNECSVKEFCNFVIDNVKEKVSENDGLPLNMILIYTNISDELDIGCLMECAARLEKLKKMVETVVVVTQ